MKIFKFKISPQMNHMFCMKVFLTNFRQIKSCLKIADESILIYEIFCTNLRHIFRKEGRMDGHHKPINQLWQWFTAIDNLFLKLQFCEAFAFICVTTIRFCNATEINFFEPLKFFQFMKIKIRVCYNTRKNLTDWDKARKKGCGSAPMSNVMEFINLK